MTTRSAPSLSSRWQRPAERPLVLGHRGARRKRLENTLAAFEQSRIDGADGIEFDVQLSADGLPFVAHDETFTRVSDGAIRSRLAELDSHTLDHMRLPGGEGPPRLQTVLDWAARYDQLLNIELKSYAPARDPLPRMVAEVLTATPGVERIVVSSFHPELLLQLHAALPHVQLGLLFTAEEAPVLDSEALRPLAGAALHPPKDWLLERPGRVQEYGAGRAVNTWTVNNPEEARELAPYVNALISDCPDQLLRALTSG